MVNIAVCDDNSVELSHVTMLLKQYQAQHCLAVRIDIFSNAIDLMNAIHSVNYQLLLLDILMPGFSGIQAAREIRTFDSETKIIFLTSSPEYAVESYSVDAFYYLLKPVREDDLFPVLDRLLRQFQQAEDALLLTFPSGVIRLPYSRLEVLEVNSKRLLFYLNDGSIQKVSGTMTQYEPQLLERREFVKVHRSYLVNMDYIRHLKGNVLVTCSGVTVPVSRLLSSQVHKTYMDFLFQEERQL